MTRVQTILLLVLISATIIFWLAIVFLGKSSPKKNQITWNPTSLEEINEKIKEREDTPLIYQDVNRYLKDNGKSSISPKEVSSINNTTLLANLQAKKNNILVIDIREKREYEKFIRLKEYPTLRYIRFGDIINDKLTDVPRDTQIVIVGFTTNRGTVAASYLLSKGYPHVKVLKGGLLQWAIDNLPLAINEYTPNKDLQTLSNESNIGSILPYIAASSSATMLKFEPYSPTSVSILLWDTTKLRNYINSMHKNDYILYCNDDFSCYEASYFWYEAKDTINIIGYTGHNYRNPITVTPSLPH